MSEIVCLGVQAIFYFIDLTTPLKTDFIGMALRYCGFTKRFAVLGNSRVISMRFAVFLCYSVRYLRVLLGGFAVLVPPLTPPSNTVISHTFAYSSRWSRKP